MEEALVLRIGPQRTECLILTPLVAGRQRPLTASIGFLRNDHVVYCLGNVVAPGELGALHMHPGFGNTRRTAWTSSGVQVA